MPVPTRDDARTTLGAATVADTPTTTTAAAPDLPSAAPRRSSRLRRRLGATVATLATVAGMFGFAVVQAAPASAYSTYEQRIVRDINYYRAAHHLAPLRVAWDLEYSAEANSRAMAARHTLFHTYNLFGRICCWTVLSENVGDGATISSVENAFYASYYHRRNILDSRVTQVGVGAVYGDGKWWITEDFRRP